MIKCKCGADIDFIQMVSGKKMPVDAKPEQMILVAEHELGRMVKVFRPHWGTCPLAKQFKKDKGD